MMLTLEEYIAPEIFPVKSIESEDREIMYATILNGLPIKRYGEAIMATPMVVSKLIEDKQFCIANQLSIIDTTTETGQILRVATMRALSKMNPASFTSMIPR
jgi:hypothetical protein